MWETKTRQELYKTFKTTTKSGGEKLICLSDPEHLLLNFDETGLMSSGLIHSNKRLLAFSTTIKDENAK